MKAKTLVSRYLKKEGRTFTESEIGLNFSYEGWNFLLWNDKRDPLFFRLTLPGVFDVTDKNFAGAIMAANNVNWNYKVVKAVVYEYADEHDDGASVWLCYEQMLTADADMAELLPHAVQTLLAACDSFMKQLADE